MEEKSTVNESAQTSVQTPSEPDTNLKKNRFLTKKWIFAVAILLVLAILGTVSSLYLESSGTKPVACTQEAKLCPDGSSVGRTGPKCEFAKCPATTPKPTSYVSITKSPTPTCTPRPKCLDTTPRCMIAETSNMCPPTITPTQ